MFDSGDRLHLSRPTGFRPSTASCPTAFPRKGEVLTQISHFWFGQTAEIVANHLAGRADQPLPANCRKFSDNCWAGEASGEKDPAARHRMRRARLSAGIGWKEYQKTRMRLRHQTACGPEADSCATAPAVFTRDQGRNRAR